MTIYNLRKIVGTHNLAAQFINIMHKYKMIEYNINVLRQTACLVVNPIYFDNFYCTHVG